MRISDKRLNLQVRVPKQTAGPEDKRHGGAELVEGAEYHELYDRAYPGSLAARRAL
jgi:hypothetical protein